MNPAAPGLFGKVYTLRDYVTRRLPREFVDAWDAWLQAGLAESVEQLGANWRDVYMTSPLWRFGLGPGLCGGSAWAGVLMPSIDGVGRCYPLTLAAPVQDSESLLHLLGTHEGEAWFARLESLSRSALADGFDLESLEQHLQACPPPCFTPIALALGAAAGAGPFARHIGMSSLEQTPAALRSLGAVLLNRCLPSHSLWCTAGSERGIGPGPALLLVEGLPPTDAYAALLSGHWSQGGWAMQSGPARALFDPDVTVRRPQAQAPAWRSWGLCKPGMKRELNEDALLERAGDGLWAVADGMGGHCAGDVASRAVVDALAGVPPAADLAGFADLAERALSEANGRLRRLAAESGDGRTIGSTVVALLARGGHCAFLWAGDSRLYRFRAGKLEQLTRDHSLLGDMAGVFSAGEMSSMGRCDVITRAVGAHEELRLSRGEDRAQAGDVYLLCSDGLDKELPHADIDALLKGIGPADAAPALMAEAEARGARDNVTVLVVEFFVA